MSRVAKLVVWVGAVLYFGMTLASQAQARPLYCKLFIASYEQVKEAKDVKCGVCHPGKEKKQRNAYGQCLTKCLGTENIKEEAVVKEAFKKAEAGKAPDGKTFGELLKEGKLPVSK